MRQCLQHERLRNESHTLSNSHGFLIGPVNSSWEGRCGLSEKAADVYAMGFEELISELHKQSEAEGKKIISAAEKGAEKIQEQSREKTEESLRAAKKEAAAYVKQESSERITSARLSAKKLVDEARDEAVEASLRQVWQKFRSDSLGKGTYGDLLNRLIKEGMRELGSTDATVYVRDEDRSLASGFRLGKLPAEYSGGAIIESSNGKIRVNKTLEETFAQKKGALRKQIYDKLF